MSKERLHIPINPLTIMPDGTSIRVRRIEESRAIPGSVAQHEAAHVIASDGIESATIIPSGNALGTTTPKRMTPAAAGAAAAMGHRGVGWDLFLAQHVMGVHAESAKSQARAVLSGQEEEMHEVASLLEERKTIGQPDVDEARRNVRNRREGIFPVEVSIQSAHGELQIHKTESYHGKVLVPGEWLELGKAA